MKLQRLAIAPCQLQGETIELTIPQQHYLNRVLRLHPGDYFIAMNGKGQWWLAELEANQAQIIEPISIQTELPIAITLMVALPKGNGFDEVVRSCTELGVSCLAPIISDRTLLNPSPQKLERWRRIATEAAEQSERSFVPEILEPVAFTTAVAAKSMTQRYICLARGNYPHLNKAINLISTTSEIIIATGSEGGWTEFEVESAIAAGFQPVSLGSRILRAVTAPIVALSVVAAHFEG